MPMTDETTETEATETTEPEAVEAPDLELTVAERDAEILRWKTMIAQHMPDVDIDNEIRFVVPTVDGSGFEYRPSALSAPSAKPVKARTAGATRSSAKAQPKSPKDMDDNEFDAYLANLRKEEMTA